MIANIVTSLAAALISALVFVAYQHPRVYLSFADKLSLSLDAALLFLAGHSFGFSEAKNIAAQSISKSKMANFNSNWAPSILILISIFIASSIFFAVLKHGVTKLKNHE